MDRVFMIRKKCRDRLLTVTSLLKELVTVEPDSDTIAVELAAHSLLALTTLD